MAKVYKAGDKVRVARRDAETFWTYGLTGTVVVQDVEKKARGWDDLDVLVEFSDKDANGQGHDELSDDNSANRWWINGDNLDPVEDVLTLGDKPFTTAHFRAGSQTSTILSHLLRGKSITNNESMLVYGIYRLSDCIHKIRNAGFDVVTDIRTDEVGRDYSRYTLRTKAA
jgi:hypothetical protein